jgi:Spy/CpxP family protein refolding chaperone
MKRRLFAILAAAALMAASAGAVSASDNYNPNTTASECGQAHGSFGAFGKDSNWAGGADGQLTGANNSAKGCQSNTVFP